MSKQRITFWTIRSGQPRAYADTEHVARMLVERTGFLPTGRYDAKDDVFRPLGTDMAGAKLTPQGWPELVVENFVHYMQAYSGWPAKPEGWWSTRLDYMRQVGPGEIEWRTVTPYTD